MSTDDPIDDLQKRIVGQRYYDKENDESLTVVGLSVQDGVPVLAKLQYDDGVAWDEVSTPDLLTPEEADLFRVEEGGIDSGRYEQLGSGPRIHHSHKWCSEGHKWTPMPDEIWPEGVPESDSSVQMNDRYLNLARCKRCGLSGSTILEFTGGHTPWFCARCEDVAEGDELSYFVNGWEDKPVCVECKNEVE